MADGRKEYDVTIGGIVHSMLLDDGDAERYGDKATPHEPEVEAKEAEKPANKARTARNK